MCNDDTTGLMLFTTGEILVDKASNGKERPWKNKKERSVLISDHYVAANFESKADRVRDCANVLKFKMTEGKLRLYQTWFCKVRLCPMCNWRRSLKIASQNKLIVETANERVTGKWLFLTLTVRNVGSEELSKTVSEMFEGFNRLTKYKRFKTSVRGYFRALEITRNRDPQDKSFGSYHPHFHVLLFVPNGYFKKKELYITQKDWTSLWQKAMKLDYTPIVHVQKVKPKKEIDIEKLENYKRSLEEQNAIFEVSKYPVKDTDVIKGNKVTTENVETLLVLDEVLARKRLIGYGGLLKEIHKELNLSDSEDGDLIHVDDEINEEDETANAVFDVVAYWNMNVGNYVIQE